MAKIIRLLTLVAMVAAMPGMAFADMSVGGQKITNVANGVATTDAATVGQLGGLAPGHAATSVLGVAGSSTGTPTDITAGTDGFVLRQNGTTLGWGTLPVASFGTGVITAAKLAASGVTAATYGSASAVAVCTFNAQGQATSCSSTNISIASGAVSGLSTIATTGAISDSTGTLSVARGGTGATAATGTGNVVLATSPTLVTPNLGTASGGDVSSAIPTHSIAISKLATGTAGNLITYDASGNPAAVATGTTGQALLSNGTGAAPTFQTLSGGGNALTTNPLSQFAATTSAQFFGVISDETGSGAVVGATSPTLTTPTLGAATATTLNKLTFTQPATGSTLTLSDGVTLTVPSTVNTGNLAPLASPTFTGTVTLPTVTVGGAEAHGNNNVTGVKSLTWNGEVDNGNKTGASQALADFTTGNFQKLTLTGNVSSSTWTMPAATTKVQIKVCQDGTGSRTIAWPTSPTPTWLGTASSSTAPTLTTTASACDFIAFYYDGTNVVGQASQPSSGGSGITSLTGDATASGSGAVAVTNVNAPDGFTQAGKIVATAIAAPSTPASGKGAVYMDSTSLTMAVKNASGTVSHMGQTKAAVTSNWLRSFADDGTFGASQPAFTDVSGSVAAAQMPALTGDVTTSAGAVATTIAANAVTNAKMATMAASTVKMNNTGGSATPTDVAVGTAFDALTTKGADIASATTTSIAGQVGHLVHVTGTTTITSFGNCTAGDDRLVVFTGALTLTYNGTSLITATGANRTTAAGDAGDYFCDSTNNWRETSWTYAEAEYVDNGNVSGASPALGSWVTSRWFRIAQNGTITGTPTWTAPRHPGQYTFEFCQDSTGTRTGFVFPTSPTIKWGTSGGTAPTPPATANKCDFYVFRWDGTTLFGLPAAQTSAGF